jgi:tetratricopeptide (TPR) repeat protein
LTLKDSTLGSDMSETVLSLTPKELSLFAERIGRSLAEQPLELGVAIHRQQVADALRRVGQGSFYHFLTVGPGSQPSEVHQAYERLARLVHPAHAQRLGWEDQKDVLAMLFEQATQAYLTLSHPERRKAYDREFAADEPAARLGAPARREENRTRAREAYQRAEALAKAEEIHYALELVREAARIDPQPEYFILLGDLLSRNERWLSQALDAYRKALELGSADPRLLSAIRQVRAKLSEPAPPAAEEAKPRRRFFGQRVQ